MFTNYIHSLFNFMEKVTAKISKITENHRKEKHFFSEK
jgi:hypothetical protein